MCQGGKCELNETNVSDSKSNCERRAEKLKAALEEVGGVRVKVEAAEKSDSVD